MNKKPLMKPFFLKFISMFSLLFILTTESFAQDAERDSIKDRDWRIEIEPASFFLRGYNLQVSRNLTKNNRLNVGLYTLAVDIPTGLKADMFNNVPDEADVRMGFELAVVARYKLKLVEKESNPYVGVIIGWEYFDISQDSLEDVRITTMVATPYVGYELYFFKQMLYLNPQIRAVFYFAHKNDHPLRTEEMRTVFMLPVIALGIRL